MHKKTLQRIRRVLAALFFLGITLMFLDFTGTLHRFLGWMAKVQFLPAVLALNFIVIAILLIITLLFGRIYCSVICPLGVFQDGVAHVHNWAKKNRYTYSKAHNILRYIVLAVFIVLLIAGLSSLAALLAPYSAYGRIVQNLFAPVWQWINNGLAALSEYADLHHRDGDVRGHRNPGMAQRPHLLQQHLSRGHFPEFLQPFLLVQDAHR